MFLDYANRAMIVNGGGKLDQFFLAKLIGAVRADFLAFFGLTLCHVTSILPNTTAHWTFKNSFVIVYYG